MNVLRDTAILDLQRNNVEVLEEQLRQTRDRFNVGEVTRTDVAQAEARLAAIALAGEPRRGQPAHQHRAVPPSRSASSRVSSRPGGRSTSSCRRTIDSALKIAFNEHPAINASLHGVDAAELQVKIDAGRARAEPRPRRRGLQAVRLARLRGDKACRARSSPNSPCRSTRAAKPMLATRQAKEIAGQRRLEANSIRDQVRAAVISVLGPARSGARPDHRRAGAGPGLRDRPQRRPRGSARRPAHHPRRLQRAAGIAQRARQSDHRPARPGRRARTRSSRRRGA